MPPIFAITASTSSVRLDDERRGEALFTVYNASGRHVKGRAYVETKDKAEESWLSIEGITEREFGVATTVQYVVRIAVPLDVPPGVYSFQLNMEEVKQGGGAVVEGPGVAISVPELPPEEEEKRCPWWCIVALVVGALIVTGLLLWLLIPLRGRGPGYALHSPDGAGYVWVEGPIEFGFEDAFAIEAWIYPSSLGSEYYETLFVGYGPTMEFGLYWRESENPVWCLDVYPEPYGEWISVRSTEAGGPKVGEWQHLAATYNGTTVELYRNGKRVTGKVERYDGEATGRLEGRDMPEEAVRARAEGLRFLHMGMPEGTVDEVRLWDRARSQGQIRAGKNRILDGRERGLVAYYRFDEGKGQVAGDGTLYLNHGRLGSEPVPDGRDPAWVESDAPLWQKPFRLWTLLLALGVLVLAGGGVAAYILWLRPAGILPLRR
jgi:hypothetical protein